MRRRGLLDAALDRSVFFSFDRSGYARHAAAFASEDLDVDLSGRVALVTGANAGLGRSAARGLAARGADVLLLCRDRQRGREAVAAIKKEVGGRPALELLDAGNLGSIRDLARRFRRSRVDILVHNAGVLPETRDETEDGIELTLATHLVGPFLLTHLLLPKLRRAGGRVIFVSSGGMYTQRLDMADPAWTTEPYDGVRAYAETKRGQVVLAELIAERLAGSGVVVNSMHPGWADSPGVRSSLPRFWRVMRRRLRTIEEGADTILWLAVCPRISEETGGFWFDRAPAPTHLLPWTRETPAQREALWDLCRRLAGVARPFEGRSRRKRRAAS
jgi:NAD(P)-dependent dehydrogenase (short-subunit alcohol dehydrogenase family)